jgi:hypothetical protein
MTGLLDALRSWLSPTCDVPGCDDDAEPLWVGGGLAWLCADHTVEWAVAAVDVGGDD